MGRKGKQPPHLRAIAGQKSDQGALMADDGRPLPVLPRLGFKLKVKWGGRWHQWTGWKVVRVNSRSFYVYGDGGVQRYDLDHWHDWLLDRREEGEVTIMAEPPGPKLTLV